MNKKQHINPIRQKIRDFFTLNPLTQKRLKRFKSIKRAYVSLWILVITLLFAFFAEFFINSRALVMKVDGTYYFPVISKMLYAKDFNFHVDNELELNYKAFGKELKKTGRGWLIMPFIPYNPFESDTNQGSLAYSFEGCPFLGVAVNKKTDVSTDDPKEYTWIDVTELDGVAMPADQSGKKRYLWIKYADSANPQGRISNFPASERYYIGLAWDKDDSLESDNARDYQWYKIGSMGAVPQPNGEYTWIRYAKGSQGEMYPPLPPSWKNRHLLGTDRIGRDVLARLVYGYRIAITFSLIIVFITFLIGVTIGVLMGYYGGLFDTILQRLIEIWEQIPFLYMIMIMSVIFKPTFGMFVFIYVIFSWTGKTWGARAMTYRERERDYVLAAKAMGASTWRIARVHIIPNVMVIIITALPFAISGGISSLTALDYLGYGLRPPTPSWGELLSVGIETYAESPWILSSIVIAMVLVLVMITFVGEGLRDAYDPKKYTVYR